MNLDKTKNRRENEWVIKTRKELKQKMDDIKRQRIKNKLDDPLRPIGYGELVEASFRFEPLLDILKKADIKRDKNAD
jgi:hypothetical protein